MSKEMGKLIAKVWEDASLKARLKSDPKSVLAEYGIKVPANKEIEVLEATEETTFIVLPPAGEESKVIPLDQLPESYGLDAVARVIITKAGKDAVFRKLTLADSMAALKQVGITVPAGHTIKIVENSSSKSYVVIPRAPQAGLSLGELDKVAGGGGTTVTTTQTTQTQAVTFLESVVTSYSNQSTGQSSTVVALETQALSTVVM